MRRTHEMKLKEGLERRTVSLPLVFGALIAVMNVLSAVVMLATA